VSSPAVADVRGFVAIFFVTVLLLLLAIFFLSAADLPRSVLVDRATL
jgi:hypothetical protein